MITLIAATRAEMRGVSREIRIKRKLPVAAGRAWIGRVGDREVLGVQSGMGKWRAEAAASAALAHCPTDLVLSIGFAGGLIEHLAVGDVVLCTRLHETSQTSAPIVNGSQEWLDIARRALVKSGLQWLEGGLVTIDHLAASPAEKMRLGENCQAQAVDMESYWVARLAEQAGKPWLALRAISDASHDWLPDVGDLPEMSGLKQVLKGARLFAGKPGMIQSLPSLMRDIQRATRALSAFMAAFWKELEAPGLIALSAGASDAGGFHA